MCFRQSKRNAQRIDLNPNYTLAMFMVLSCSYKTPRGSELVSLGTIVSLFMYMFSRERLHCKTLSFVLFSSINIKNASIRMHLFD